MSVNRAITRGAGAATRQARVLTDADDIEPWLHDAAHYPGGHTTEVCLPRSESQLAAVLARRLPVLAVGAQSSLTGGATPRGEIVLSMARMDSVIEWKSDSVVVEPGLLLATLEEQLRERDLYYPPAPTFDGASVGGTVATNAAGAATFKHGTTRPWVRAISVLLACGEVLDLERGQVTADEHGRFELQLLDGSLVSFERPALTLPAVPKCSAGYWSEAGMDLVDLFIGSEGTLGIVTRVELTLQTSRPALFAGLIPMADDEAAIGLVAALRDAPRVDIAAVEYMDRRCLELLREDGACERAGVALPDNAAAALLFQAELPPDMTTAEAAEQIAAAGDPAAGDAEQNSPLLALCRLLADHGVLDSTLPALPGEQARRDALFALREAVPTAVNERVGRAAREIDPTIAKSAGDVIVPFENFARSLERYREILDEHELDHAVWGHISDGNVHTNVMARSAGEMRRAGEAQLEIGRAAIALGGSPMSEHGVGRNEIKKRLLVELYGEQAVASMRRIKDALDPAGLLAPGVLFD